MISLDKRVITSVYMDVDLEGCDENQAFEKMVDMQISIMEGILGVIKQAFQEDVIYLLSEVNLMQYEAYSLNLRVLRSIKDKFKNAGTYVNLQPSKTLLKNIKKLKIKYHELIEKSEAMGMKDGDYLAIVNHIQEHYRKITVLIEFVNIII